MKIVPFNRSAVMDSTAILARWLLGAAFFYLGLRDALNPVGFLKILWQYNLTSSPLILNGVATELPWFEVFCGLLLLTGLAVRGTALMMAAMLVPFTILVLHRALLLESLESIPFCAISFDCGCGTGVGFICHKLTENIILFAASIWVLCGRGRQFSLRFSLFGPRRLDEPFLVLPSPAT